MAKAKAKELAPRTSTATRDALAAALDAVGVPGTKAHEAIDLAYARGITFSHEGEIASGPVGTMVLGGETEKNYNRQHGIPVEEDEPVAVDSEAGLDTVGGADVPEPEPEPDASEDDGEAGVSEDQPNE